MGPPKLRELFLLCDQFAFNSLELSFKGRPLVPLRAQNLYVALILFHKLLNVFFLELRLLLGLRKFDGKIPDKL